MVVWGKTVKKIIEKVKKVLPIFYLFKKKNTFDFPFTTENNIMQNINNQLILNKSI